MMTLTEAASYYVGNLWLCACALLSDRGPCAEIEFDPDELAIFYPHPGWSVNVVLQEMFCSDPTEMNLDQYDE